MTTGAIPKIASERIMYIGIGEGAPPAFPFQFPHQAQPPAPPRRVSRRRGALLDERMESGTFAVGAFISADLCPFSLR